jgi:hypothetical protein
MVTTSILQVECLSLSTSHIRHLQLVKLQAGVLQVALEPAATDLQLAVFHSLRVSHFRNGPTVRTKPKVPSAALLSLASLGPPHPLLLLLLLLLHLQQLDPHQGVLLQPQGPSTPLTMGMDMQLPLLQHQQTATLLRLKIGCLPTTPPNSMAVRHCRSSSSSSSSTTMAWVQQMQTSITCQT